MKVQPSCSESLQDLGDVPWEDHQEQQQLWSGASQSLEDKLCVLQRTKQEK